MSYLLLSHLIKTKTIIKMKLACLAVAAAIAVAQVAADPLNITAFTSEVVGQYTNAPLDESATPFVGLKSLSLYSDNTYTAEYSKVCNSKCGIINEIFPIFYETGSFSVTDADAETNVPNQGNTELGQVLFTPQNTNATAYSLGLGVASAFPNLLSVFGTFPHNDDSSNFNIQNLTVSCNGFSGLGCLGAHCGGFIEPAPQCGAGLTCVLGRVADAGGVCTVVSEAGGRCGGNMVPAPVCDSGLQCVNTATPGLVGDVGGICEHVAPLFGDCSAPYTVCAQGSCTFIPFYGRFCLQL